MTIMNGIQRVKNTIAHVPGAPIARGELVLEPQFARDFMAWQTGGDPPAMHDDVNLQLTCCHALGLDLICLQSPPSNAFSLPFKSIHRFAEEGLFVFWIVDGVFQHAARHRGFMALMTDIARDPEAVQAEFKHFSGHVLSTMDQGIEAGVHGIILADDIAYNQGTFTSPDFIEQYLFPFWKAHVLKAGDRDVPLFFHSDGNLKAVMPLITAAGFVGLQGIESDAGMDIGGLKKQYDSELCLMGGLSPSLLSSPKVPNLGEIDKPSLRREVSALIASASGDGGFIFGTSSGLHAGMSPERVQQAYRLSFKQEAVCVADGKATDC